MKVFHANGKLLLSSEYVILNGARALAVPLNLGQHLEIQKAEAEDRFEWTAKYGKATWFSAVFNTKNLELINTSDPGRAAWLSEIFKAIITLDPYFTRKLPGTKVITTLDFHPDWGLGSSSTLLYLLASWAGIDPWQLHFKTSRGSGYDIACAEANGPLFYNLDRGRPEVVMSAFSPSFADNLWFAWLGKKENSAVNIGKYLSEKKPEPETIKAFNDLTYKMAGAETLEEFGKAISLHESLMSEILEQPAVRESRFPDLEGWVKSLGAWGGDFVLLASSLNESKLKHYLWKKGIRTVFNYKKLVRYEHAV